MKKLKLFVFVAVLLLYTRTQAQCNVVETIVICDITQIDGDNDSTPDGILNLYQEYTNQIGGTLPTGTWFDPDYNFVLTPATGDVNVWGLDNSTEDITDYYEYQLFTTACGTITPAVTIQLHIGAFSGVAAQNVVICDIGIDSCNSQAEIDLFTALNASPVAPHANGIWTYDGYDGVNPPTTANVNGSTFTADIPYVPYDANLEDTITFNFTYTVPGVAPCNIDMQTQVQVTVSREVSAGFANRLYVCESDILAGNHNLDINLLDDAYLVAEDIEGTWSSAIDPTNQISNPGDSVINLEEIYNNYVAGNPKFGCHTFSFDYEVQSHSTTPMCTTDKTSRVEFTFFEYLRPFQQDLTINNEFCIDGPTNSINLYDYLEFTTENGVLFDYPENQLAQWSLITSPNGAANSGGAFSISTLTNADAGTYVFQYTVAPEYNCPEILSVLPVFPPETTYQVPYGCSGSESTIHPCAPEMAQVTIVIHPKNYAGEDTGILEFCESTYLDVNNQPVPVDLIALLNINGIDGPVYVGNLGTWTDLATGNVITNPYTLPQINDQQTFNFNYATTTANGCLDDADLSFTIYEQYQAGTSALLNLCNTDSVVDLFTILTDNPNTSGTWTGPGGFTSSNNNVLLDPATFSAGTYTYSVPANGLCAGNQATVTVTIQQSLNAGADTNDTLCQSIGVIDLVDYLDPMADTGGTFVDTDATGVLMGSTIDVSQLNAGTYNFEYQLQAIVPCAADTATVTLTIATVPTPIANDQVFCINDGATIADLVFSVTTANYYWYDTATSTTPLSFTEVLINGEDYYIEAEDANGCLSARTQVNVTILPLTDPSCDAGITVVVTPTNPINLGNLPVAFPNFEIKIFNRYGTTVYKGNINTPPFEGEANVSLTLGKKLPAGVYFYIFNPKDGITAPFQGDFYLSR